MNAVNTTALGFAGVTSLVAEVRAVAATATATGAVGFVAAARNFILFAINSIAIKHCSNWTCGRLGSNFSENLDAVKHDYIKPANLLTNGRALGQT